MAEGNGKAVGGMMAPPTESIEVMIGGQPLRVPALTLFSLERAREHMERLNPELNWVVYAKEVLEIIAIALDNPELPATTLARFCSVPEMQALPASLAELFRVSGFTSGEAEAAGEESPGIGTSTPSPPTSQPQESAAETSTG